MSESRYVGDSGQTCPYVPSQGWYDNIIAVDPVDLDVVWVGGSKMGAACAYGGLSSGVADTALAGPS